MKKVVIFILLLASSACFSEQQAMIEINDKTKVSLFAKLFKEKGIPYNLQNGNQFYYPESYREKVEQVSDLVWGPIDRSKKGVSVNTKVAPTLAAELVKRGVAFEAIPGEGMVVFSWGVYYDKKAMEAASSVVH